MPMGEGSANFAQRVCYDMDAWSAFHRASSDDAAEDFADNPTLLPGGPQIYRKRPRSADKRPWSLIFDALGTCGPALFYETWGNRAWT